MGAIRTKRDVKGDYQCFLSDNTNRRKSYVKLGQPEKFTSLTSNNSVQDYTLYLKWSEECHPFPAKKKGTEKELKR